MHLREKVVRLQIAWHCARFVHVLVALVREIIAECLSLVGSQNAACFKLSEVPAKASVVSPPFRINQFAK